MRGPESLMEWLVKLVFILLLAPVLLCLVIQIAAALLWALVPWFVGLAVLMGLVAGASAGLVMRGRLPRRNGDNHLPPGLPPAARPRGLRNRQREED